MSDAGTLSISQDTDVPAGQGFSKSLKLDCTTADASIASGSYHRLQQRIEAQNMAAVESGSANAKQTVWSFWIKFDNASGDFCVNVLNLSDSNNRVIAKKFTYASGAGWQKYSFVVPGDTGGNALTPDNSGAYYMQIFMQAGTNFTSGTLQTTWDTRTDTNRAAGQTLQLASSTDNNMYLTGCQWEIGDAPSDFEHTPFDVQLQRCQRYFYRFAGGTSEVFAHAIGSNSTSAALVTTSPVQFRAAPSASHANLAIQDTINVLAVTGITIRTDLSANFRTIYVVLALSGGSVEAFRPYFATTDGSSNGYLDVSAEL